MRELYLKTLKNAVDNFYSDITNNNLFNINEVYHLLTFVGLSKIRDYENSNVENSCSLFPFLRKLTLFCTSDSFDNAIFLKNKLFKQNLEIQIIIIESNISNKNLYLKILKTINTENFDSIFFDTTQGMKSISITFYKLGSELGIKSLNWVSTHSLKEDYNLFRCVDNLRIDFLSNPKNENYRFFKLLNSSIDNFDFKNTSNLYKSINDNEKAIFLNLYLFYLMILILTLIFSRKMLKILFLLFQNYLLFQEKNFKNHSIF